MTKPKTAIVAILDEKIIGGFVYQIDIIGKKKIGFISFLIYRPRLSGLLYLDYWQPLKFLPLTFVKRRTIVRYTLLLPLFLLRYYQMNFIVLVFSKREINASPPTYHTFSNLNSRLSPEKTVIRFSLSIILIRMLVIWLKVMVYF